MRLIIPPILLYTDAAWGIDATGPVLSEKKDRLTNTYHILTLQKEYPGQGRAVLTDYMKQHTDKFVFVVDQGISADDISTPLCGRFLIILMPEEIWFFLMAKSVWMPPKKQKEEGLTREWPKDIEMTQEMKLKVTERWTQYGIDKIISKN